MLTLSPTESEWGNDYASDSFVVCAMSTVELLLPSLHLLIYSSLTSWPYHWVRGVSAICSWLMTLPLPSQLGLTFCSARLTCLTLSESSFAGILLDRCFSTQLPFCSSRLLFVLSFFLFLCLPLSRKATNFPYAHRFAMLLESWGIFYCFCWFVWVLSVFLNLKLPWWRMKWSSLCLLGYFCHWTAGAIIFIICLHGHSIALANTSFASFFVR